MARKTNKISFKDLTKRDKRLILEYIVKTDCSIKTAGEHFKVTQGTIDKIFEESFPPPNWTKDYETIDNESN
jgi:hypothetical protein